MPPIPKDPATRRRRNVEVRHNLVADVPDAPALFGEWSEPTRRWWATWVAAPQTEFFTATDYQRLQQLLPLVERYWFAPSVPMMAEIRLNESLLGATVVDRMRLRWDVTRPAANDDDKPATNTFRERLKVVDDAVGGA